MNRYKCVCCGKIIEEEETLIFIFRIENNLRSPVCSEECAQEEIDAAYLLLTEKANRIKNQEIKEEVNRCN